MSKELRIEIVIPLPEALFEQAAVLSHVHPLFETFTHALQGVASNMTVTHALVTPRVGATKAASEEPPILDAIKRGRREAA